jgi:MEDS: MEthanogen/methylotroph, DcmR Sensory domain
VLGHDDQGGGGRNPPGLAIVFGALQGFLVDDRDYSERLASIARLVEVLGDQLAAGQHEVSPEPGCGPRQLHVPSQSLIDELVQLVVELQRHVVGGPFGMRPGRRDRRFNIDTSFGSRIVPGTAITESWGRGTATEVGGAVTNPGFGLHEPGGVHGVHFSRSHEHAVAAVVDMVCDAMDRGRAVVLVATGFHRRWIESELHQRGAQLDRSDFHILDAAATLSSLLVDGTPDRDRFRSVIGTLITDVAGRATAGVSVYGEMVGILWEQGDAASATRLEGFWNELQRDVRFSLMCGYRIDGRTNSTDLDPIRRLHSHVS